MDPNIAIVSAANDDFIESQIIPTLKPFFNLSHSGSIIFFNKHTKEK